MQKIILILIFVLFHQINSKAEAIVNTRAIGFSEDGNFFAFYKYKQYSESISWYGCVCIMDLKENRQIDKVELEKEYGDSISDELLVKDLLKNLLHKDRVILDKYGIIVGNNGFLSYYKSIHSYLLNNNGCMTGSDSLINFQISVCTERFVTQSLGGAREYLINLSTFIVDEENTEDLEVDCPDCYKLFKLEIINEGCSKLIYDFKNKLNNNNCYRDYSIGRVYLYGQQKIVILMYGMKAGFEGLDIEPIIITGIFDCD